jgi:hypothetical protein
LFDAESTAAFFSGAFAAGDIQAVGPTTSSAQFRQWHGRPDHDFDEQPAGYVSAFRSFIGSPTALGDGAIAYSNRAVGLLGQPLYPSGVPGAPNGPLSLPFENWSPFKTGLELDLTYTQIALSIAYIINQEGFALNINGAVIPAPTPANPVPLQDVRVGCTDIPRLPNGFTLFPGSVPIYRGTKLVGGIGASGDGSDQSDLVAFLALSNGAAALNTGLNQAPNSIRADILKPLGTRLLYVQCPQAPFIDTAAANACEGL